MPPSIMRSSICRMPSRDSSGSVPQIFTPLYSAITVSIVSGATLGKSAAMSLAISAGEWVSVQISAL